MKALSLVTVVVVAGACLSTEERDTSGQTTAERFLAAAAGGARDRGWSLLRADAHMALQQEGIDRERYADLVAEARWEDIIWSVDYVTGDDLIACSVVLFGNGHLLPAVLVRAPAGVIATSPEDRDRKSVV